MNAVFASLLFAVGSTAWIHSKFMRRTNNGKSSLVAAVVIGVIAFIVFYTLFATIIK
jgi:hypothetical protein